MFKRRHLILLLLIFLISCTANAVPVEPEAHVLVLWHPFSDARREALQALSDHFNMKNEEDLTLILEYQADMYEKIAASPPSHRPDLALIFPEDLQRYQSVGLTVPLSNIDQTTPDIFPMAEALYTHDNTLHALPIGLATYVLYYNADWLKDLGYTARATTWEELQQIACEATNLQGRHMGLGIAAQPGILLALMTANGLNPTDPEEAEAFINNAGAEAATTLQNIVSAACGKVYEVPTEGAAQFSSGAAAMMMDVSLRYGVVEQALNTEHNFQSNVGLLPGRSSGEPAPTLWHGPGIILLSPPGSRQENAQKVLDWFMTPQAQLTWSTATGYIPVRQSLAEQQLRDAKTTTLEADLLNLALQASHDGTWAIWPAKMNTATCRAALVRGLIELNVSQSTVETLKFALQTCQEGNLNE